MPENMLDEITPEELAEVDALENSDAPIEVTTPGAVPTETDTPEEGGEAEPAEATNEAVNPAADPKRPDGYVPNAALQEARKEAKEYRQKLDGLMEKLSEAALQKQQPAQAEDPDPAPDKDEDPFGYLQWENRQLRKEVDGVKQTTGQMTEQQKAQQEVATFINTYRAKGEEFAARTPDFQDAYEFLREDRLAFYEGLYPEMTQDDIIRTVNNEELNLARQFLENGINPAERFYNVAKSRGYKPTSAKVDDATAKLQQQKQMQDANVSLGTLPGSGGVKDTIDDADVSKMSQEQLYAFIAKNPQEAERILQGL